MVKVTGLSLLPMEAASVRERSSLRLSPGRVAAVLVALTLAAWILTFDRMRGMDAGPGTDLGGLGWFLGIWVTMMAAMMLANRRFTSRRGSSCSATSRSGVFRAIDAVAGGWPSMGMTP